jgi:hypothetical protein
MQYIVKAHADLERRLKEQVGIINARDEEDAWRKAWIMFPEYKELSVTRKE